MYKVFLLIGMLFGIYVLAQTLALSAAIRLVFGLNSNRLKMAAALVLALPQTAAVMFGPSGLLGPMTNATSTAALVFYATLLPTLAGWVFWLLARRGLKDGHHWIEAVLVLAVIGLQLLTVNGWIAG
jgi:hypothetical protein